MLTVMLLLALAAFVCTIVAALGKWPLWVAVILLVLMELLRALPLGR